MPSSIISTSHTTPLRVKGLGLEGKWGGGGAKSFMKGTGRKKDLTAGRVSDIISVQLELPAYTPIFAYQSLIA